MHINPFFLALYYKDLKVSVFSLLHFLSSQKEQQGLVRVSWMLVSYSSAFTVCFSKSISWKPARNPLTKYFISNLHCLVSAETMATSYRGVNMHPLTDFTKTKSEKKDFLFQQYHWLTVTPEILFSYWGRTASAAVNVPMTSY